MDISIRSTLNEVLQETSRWKESSKPLVCFCPMQGFLADGRLMLVGRALYGWGASPFTAAQMELESERNKILENTIGISTSATDCPLQRLHDLWWAGLANGSSKYNPKRSSFWSTAREVVQEFSQPEEREDWVSYLYWTNLYKISPATTGNPDGDLKQTINSSSQKMLATEVARFRPKRILFLTGRWWAESFLPKPPLVTMNSEGYAHVFQTGFWPLGDGSQAEVVIADHPQGKKRGLVVSEIMKAFGELSARRDVFS